MILKSLVTGVAAAAAIGGAALGVTSIAAPVASATPGAYNIPQQPAPCDASAGQLRSVIDGLLAQGVPASGGKSDLVEGGIGFAEGRIADRAIRNAYADGSLPVSYDVAPPVCNPDGTAATTLSAKGRSLNAVFVPGGRYGYVLSKASATSALSLFG